MINVGTKWAHFAADKPGIVPAGTEGASQDIVAYENVITIVDNEGVSQQLMIGTLVQIGNAWRLADLPRTSGQGSADAICAGGRIACCVQGAGALTSLARAGPQRSAACGFLRGAA